MSNRLNALREKQGKTADSMDAMLQKATDEKRDLTAEENQAFKDFESDLEKTAEAIKVEERVEKIKADLAKPVNIPGNEQKKTAAVPKFRYGKMKTFRGPNAEDDAYKSGMWVRATIFREQSSIDWCKENGVPITKAQSEGTNSAGGYLVNPEMSSAIIDLREEVGTFRQNMSVKPMASDVVNIPKRLTGLTATFVAENAETTAGDKSWGQVKLTAQKLTALTRYSTELAEDAIISISDDLASEMAYAFAAKEDAVGWNGTGAASDGGIIGVRTRLIDGTHTASLVEGAATHDLFTEIDAADLSNMMAKLPLYAARNAKWYGSQVAWALVFQRLAQASGGTTMTEVTGGKPTRSYMGYPVVIDQTLPIITTTLNDVVMLLFGDLSLAVAMGERRGITVKTTEERYFEFDQIGIMATERIDINAHSLGDTTVAGPILGLIGTT